MKQKGFPAFLWFTLSFFKLVYYNTIDKNFETVTCTLHISCIAETVKVWESASEEEEVDQESTQKPDTPPSTESNKDKRSSPVKKKATPVKTKQASLMSFFQKK